MEARGRERQNIGIGRIGRGPDPAKAGTETEIPQVYAELKRVSIPDPDLRYSYEIQLFYAQAVFMKDVTDDCPYTGEFICYYPTYAKMAIPELRGYFTWRTGVRSGRLTQAPRAFAFLYVYELLNQIGVSSAQEGFERIAAFWKSYGQIDSKITPYMKRWLKDYVIFYNLEVRLLIDYGLCEASESMCRFAAAYEDGDGSALLAAAEYFSAYRLSGSRGYQENRQAYQEVTLQVFKRLDRYFLRYRKKSFLTVLFGSESNAFWLPFADAMVHTMRLRDTRMYEINACERYTCGNGTWRRYDYTCSPESKKLLGGILKTIDSLMRKNCGISGVLKCAGAVSQPIYRLIAETVETFGKSMRAAAEDAATLFDFAAANALPQPPNEYGKGGRSGKNGKRKADRAGETSVQASIRIDASRFDEIRTASETIQTWLLTEETPSEIPGRQSLREERQEAESACSAISEKPDRGAAPAESVYGAEAASSPSPDAKKAACYREIYTEILRAVYRNEPAAAKRAAEREGRMLSVLIEEINEFFYETVGDSVILYDGDQFAIAQDYIKEIESLLPL